MDDEVKELLKKTVELGEVNKQALDKIVRYQKSVQIFATLKWTVIILSAVGAFYYLQPFWEGLWSAYNGLIETLGTINLENGGLPIRK